MNKRYLSVFAIFSLLLITACGSNSDPKTKYTWDDDGMLVIDGERTFIIGSYHVPKSDRPYAELADNGYNYVHVSANQEELDAAHQHHLYTWMSTGLASNDESEKRISELIRFYKSYPSLLCWEISDEPAFTWNSADLRIQPDKMIETYEIIKQEDPNHFIYTNHGPVNLVSTLQKYNSSTDIIACDVYPVIPHGITPTYALYPDGLQGDLLNPYISQVGEYADKMQRVTNHSKPLIMVLQGFAWEMLKKENERNPEMVLYPTYEQSRFMAFNAIVHGANGINYWGMNYTSQPSSFMDDLNRVTKELAQMRNILSSRSVDLDIEKTYHELRYSVDTGIEILSKKMNDRHFLLTVNSDKNPIRITLGNLGDFKLARVIKEDKTIPIQDGEFTDDYTPFDVHIYELK
jgi:hypothetical protein